MEVLKLEYDASTEGVTVTCDAVKESEHSPGVMAPQLGVPQPTTRLTLTELAARDAKLADDFRSVLARLEPLTRGVVAARVAEAMVDPAKLTEREAEFARREEALAKQKLAIEAEEQARRAALDAEETAKRDALAAEESDRREAIARLDAEIAAKKAAAETPRAPSR